MRSSKLSSFGDVADFNSVYQVYKYIVRTKYLYVIPGAINFKIKITVAQKACLVVLCVSCFVLNTKLVEF